MTDRVGQQLGNYRLIRLLGKGGFAEVYLGEHIYLETQAAIKLLLTQLASEDLEPFRLEAKRVAHLEHPHIVRVLEFGVDGSTPYLVMSYAPNGTLRQHHPKGVALPLMTILGYVKQAADALQYAHDEHFIHRDVKPENLLVGRRQEILLSDFGIALLTQTSRSQSMQDVAGTASYMAPEQFQGKPRPASDQYSLGIIVYEWLSGDRPFHGSFTEIASQHLFVPPPPLYERMADIPAAVEQVVMTALAKDPHQRFGSVQAFATAFEQASHVEAAAGGVFPFSLNAVTDVSESQQPTQRATARSQPSTPTELIAPSSQAPVSRDVISETALTEAATRSTPSPQPMQRKEKRSSRKSVQPPQVPSSPALALPAPTYVQSPPPAQPLQAREARRVSSEESRKWENLGGIGWVRDDDDRRDQREALMKQPFLMLIKEVSASTDSGTGVTGYIWRGVVKVGDTIEIVGLKDKTRTAVITEVEMFRKKLGRGEVGDNVICWLRGVERAELERGQVLAQPGSIKARKRFPAQVYIRTKKGARQDIVFAKTDRAEFSLNGIQIPGILTLPEGIEKLMPGYQCEAIVELDRSIAIDQGIKFRFRIYQEGCDRILGIFL